MFYLVLCLLLCLVDHVLHCDHTKDRTGCFAFRWFVACVSSALDCLLFFLLSLVGYVM